MKKKNVPKHRQEWLALFVQHLSMRQTEKTNLNKYCMLRTNVMCFEYEAMLLSSCIHHKRILRSLSCTYLGNKYVVANNN